VHAAAPNKRWATLALGDGGYRGAGVGAIASTLTRVWPWTRYAVGERLSVWGAAGYGDGSLTLEPRAKDGTHAGAIRTDLDPWMAAVGLRGIALDGGDAETGFGADIGAGIACVDPKRGLGAELRGCGLLAHEAEGFLERGLSGSVTWDPVRGDRGPRLSLIQTLGVPAHGTEAMLERTTLAGPAASETGDDLRNRRLEARFGYGFPAFGDRFTAAPEIAVGLSNAGWDYSFGWRLVRDGEAPNGRSLELALELQRREPVGDRHTPREHALGLRVISRF